MDLLGGDILTNENMKKPFRLLLNILHRLLDEKADTEYVDRKKANKAGWKPDMYLGTDANGNMVEKDAPQGGTGGGIVEETDPTVPDWAKKPDKPTYTASEVGARSDTWMPTAAEIGAMPAETKIPGIDSTLKVSGAAADAKVVGEKFTEVSKEIGDAGNEVYILQKGETVEDAPEEAKEIIDPYNDNNTVDFGQFAKKNDVEKAMAGKLDADKLPETINTALAQAKESGEFDGEPGVSPHIGENENWFIGDVDTNVKARGKDGNSGVYIGSKENMPKGTRVRVNPNGRKIDESSIAQLVINLLPKYNGEVENV